MSLEQQLELAALHNQCFFSFDLGTCYEEEIVASYYKQYKRDEGE